MVSKCGKIINPSVELLNEFHLCVSTCVSVLFLGIVIGLLQWTLTLSWIFTCSNVLTRWIRNIPNLRMESFITELFIYITVNNNNTGQLRYQSIFYWTCLFCEGPKMTTMQNTFQRGSLVLSSIAVNCQASVQRPNWYINRASPLDGNGKNMWLCRQTHRDRWQWRVPPETEWAWLLRFLLSCSGETEKQVTVKPLRT